MLIDHLRRLDIPIHIFSGLDDPGWVQYRALRRVRFCFLFVRVTPELMVIQPMFVMTNAAGHLTDSPNAALVQRSFFYELVNW